jgi:hypothetical protein
MTSEYPEYPGPNDAEEDKTYTYKTSDGEKVAATVVNKEKGPEKGISVTLSYGGSV